MISATNCDSNVFERPDKFNVYRPDIDIKKEFSGTARHLAFGSSIYNCVGAAFAKLEIEIDSTIKDNISGKKLWDIKDFVKRTSKMK
ncbi:cytochrome P450 [Bacillus cereus]|uniref:Cytochrome P450 n=1 Tax=Bacillus cereus TaxID=1396 RepID=A0A9X8J2U0_BACCE|nr:cytochrome P450 [Bacillus cereus]RWQ76822.1 cytochrome P450 [Bacillus cereus]